TPPVCTRRVAHGKLQLCPLHTLSAGNRVSGPRSPTHVASRIFPNHHGDEYALSVRSPSSSSAIRVSPFRQAATNAHSDAATRSIPIGQLVVRSRRPAWMRASRLTLTRRVPATLDTELEIVVLQRRAQPGRTARQRLWELRGAHESTSANPPA